PFVFEEWVPNQRFVAEKNPDYWATDADGNQLPYLDEIEYRPIVEVAQRQNALESGEINAMHTSDPRTVAELRDLADAGEINTYESSDFGGVTYLMMNASEPPFDNNLARQALAYAADFEEYNAIIGAGILERASGPFAPGNIGHVDEDLMPEFDLERAQELVQQYEEETGQPFRFTYSTTQGQATIDAAQLLQQQAEAAGMTVEIVTVDQSTLIDLA